MKPSTQLTILRLPPGSPIPYQLLLLADPSRSAIDQYISTGVLYQAYVAGKDYFTKNYPDPIIEDGMICRDRVTLVKLL